MLTCLKGERLPIITIAFGRQRVGKTALLNAMGQYYRGKRLSVAGLERRPAETVAMR